MMKYCRCDRCGTEAGGLQTRLWQTIQHNGVTIDLCNRCADLFEVFMSNIDYVNSTPPERREPKQKQKTVDSGKLYALHDAGWGRKMIADELGVSEQTVSNYLKKREEEN